MKICKQIITETFSILLFHIATERSFQETTKFTWEEIVDFNTTKYHPYSEALNSIFICVKMNLQVFMKRTT